jgi:hypothetical protein
MVTFKPGRVQSFPCTYAGCPVSPFDSSLEFLNHLDASHPDWRNKITVRQITEAGIQLVDEQPKLKNEHNRKNTK